MKRHWDIGEHGCRPVRRRRSRFRGGNREGYAAVLFVLLFFGLMGLAALVIDIGFARLAQRQMQTAADNGGIGRAAVARRLSRFDED